MVTEEKCAVMHKATGEAVAMVSVAGKQEVTAAVSAAETAFKTIKMEPYQRYEILMKASQLLIKNLQQMAETLSMEVGKPIKEAFAEVRRAEQTLLLSAEEA